MTYHRTAVPPYRFAGPVRPSARPPVRPARPYRPTALPPYRRAGRSGGKR
jgi:hypothetical protein